MCSTNVQARRVVLQVVDVVVVEKSDPLRHFRNDLDEQFFMSSRVGGPVLQWKLLFIMLLPLGLRSLNSKDVELRFVATW